ncbi:hypothetical protein EZV62_028028 [Acer yangbiense]|uniref:Uncharacterized protein n=1 Tax=Acer yangbiense TaxID=1000413 RepID=A0A5C7GQ73_9ROSI|nr:hypothetical protein EZV62_028028 [Acer yangbiense]
MSRRMVARIAARIIFGTPEQNRKEITHTNYTSSVVSLHNFNNCAVQILRTRVVFALNFFTANSAGNLVCGLVHLMAEMWPESVGVGGCEEKDGSSQYSGYGCVWTGFWFFDGVCGNGSVFDGRSCFTRRENLANAAIKCFFEVSIILLV